METTNFFNPFGSSDSGGGSAPQPVLINKNITKNGSYQASADEADGYSAVTVDVPNTFGASDEGRVVQSGVLVAQIATSVNQNGVIDTTLNNSVTVQVPTGGQKKSWEYVRPNFTSGIRTVRYKKYFEPKTWHGLTSLFAGSIWSDGMNIYSSSGSDHYILDKATSTWEPKTWYGLTFFYPQFIWSDGHNIYYSNASQQYVLNKMTSTWELKTWNGKNPDNAGFIWTDGNNIYYSTYLSFSSNMQLILDKATSTWNTYNWGDYNIRGECIWTDGVDIYCSNNYLQYVCRQSSGLYGGWKNKTWSGLSNIDGRYVWTDGADIFYSNGDEQYILDKDASTWQSKSWGNATPSSGLNIWSDGSNIYYSQGNTQYVLRIVESYVESITIPTTRAIMPLRT